MSQALPQSPEDPFRGLLLPMEVWKAINEAHITSLEQLKALAPQISEVPSIDPCVAQIIKDRLDRLATRRTVRVRLVFGKRALRKPKRRRA
jgi:hypothetical protein